MLNADDAALRGTVALRLAIMQADFRGDHEKACQVKLAALMHTQNLYQLC